MQWVRVYSVCLKGLKLMPVFPDFSAGCSPNPQEADSHEDYCGRFWDRGRAHEVVITAFHGEVGSKGNIRYSGISEDVTEVKGNSVMGIITLETSVTICEAGNQSEIIRFH